MKVEIVEEHEDGSADAQFEMTREELHFFAAVGIKTLLREMLDEKKSQFKDVKVTYIDELFEEEEAKV